MDPFPPKPPPAEPYRPYESSVPDSWREDQAREKAATEFKAIKETIARTEHEKQVNARIDAIGLQIGRGLRASARVTWKVLKVLGLVLAVILKLLEGL